MVYRPFYLGREWVKQGHRVTIAAASYTHIRTQSPTVSGSITEEEIDGIRYVWLKTPHYHANDMKRVVNMIAFTWRLFLSGKLLSAGTEPDIVISSSTYPLDIFPAFRIARKYGARLVFEVRDLWPLSPKLLGGMSQWHPFILGLQVAEDFAYRKSDKVISVLPQAHTYMVSRGMDRGKFVYIPNGIDPMEWEADTEDMPPEHKRLIGDLRSTGHMIVGFTGAYGEATDLPTLIEAAARLRDEKIAFVIVGLGPKRKELQMAVAERKLENVFFLLPAPKASMPRLLDAMDCLYIGLKRQPLFHFGVSPNKLLDYMMAAKPVLHAIDCSNNLVLESGGGISVPPEDPDALAEAVADLNRMTPAERSDLGLRGKRYVLERHDYRLLARQFLTAVMDQASAPAAIQS